MDHKVGDKVRLKQVSYCPEFNGELGHITSLSKETVSIRLVNTLSTNASVGYNDFINLEHLKSPKDVPKQINFNFNLPIETYQSDLWFNINGVDYQVRIERMG